MIKVKDCTKNNDALCMGSSFQLEFKLLSSCNVCYHVLNISYQNHPTTSRKGPCSFTIYNPKPFFFAFFLHSFIFNLSQGDIFLDIKATT